MADREGESTEEQSKSRSGITKLVIAVNGRSAVPYWDTIRHFFITEIISMSSDINQFPMRAVPGYASSTEGIQIAIQTGADASDEDLQFFQQLGVEWAMVGIRAQDNHTLDYYKWLVKRFGDHGIKIYRITNTSVHNVPAITLNLPGRDEQIEEFKQFIRNIGEAGVMYNTYAHMGNGIWSSERGSGRGGMDARRLDINNAFGWWGSEKFEGELTHGREYTEEELWDNYAYLMREIVPVAEEAGVRIGIHPDDACFGQPFR